MNKIIGKTVIVLLLFLFSINAFASASMPKEGVGTLASDFTLSSISDKTVSLNDFKGKNVILFFFTTWCPWCRKKFPDLEKNQEKYKKDGIELVVIDAGESRAKVASFASKIGTSFDILLDRDMNVADDYGVVGVPSFVLISDEGYVLYKDNDLPDDYNKIFSR